MPGTYTHSFDTPRYKGDVTVHTGLFINNEWVDPVEGGSIEVINPTTGKHITTVSAAGPKDVDLAVDAAAKAFKTTWGLHTPGTERGRLLNKLCDLFEQRMDEFSALEALDTGKIFDKARHIDIKLTLDVFRYYAGWADKVQGKTIETNEHKLAYTRHEPFGVCGQIIPWNFPLMMLSWKVGPALATGNTIVLKPSELTPLTALKFAELIVEAGFPPGVVNILNGYGPVAGQAISEHQKIAKVAFTGSTLTGRKIMKAAAESNLKVVTLELGGKSPTVIFDDADLDQAVKWAAHGIYFNMGQACTAGSRIFVQEGVYDKFIDAFTGVTQYITAKTGDPFSGGMEHGPQVSQVQFDRIMSYIESGKSEGATLHIGGQQHDPASGGYFIQPTIFTDCKPDMKIVKEEIFGPVAAVMKFKTEEEAIALANDTSYGLACHVFSMNINRAIRVAHALEAGTAWVNCAQSGDVAVPFGGYKQSGIGRELGQYALDVYTQVKAVQINIGARV
ncbi:hypothetical protein CVT24_010143 [Panaeolus cyanescens]|uniref:Aldehyde dehydrogenase domain-containing protein n=1 Tax=Panaeolus cyanescens TaxID=181874 RepID=A0A409WLT8_9AGAR|nr:hypothetical protein CVT24_010143 [Panaeolus cyanescens]